MKLDALKKKDLEKVRVWRNQFPQSLRTPYLLTKEMQEEYYNNVICNRNSNTRYFGIYLETDCQTLENFQDKQEYKFLGYGGIENIIQEFSCGEISNNKSR
jgi:hypothetical protein